MPHAAAHLQLGDRLEALLSGKAGCAPTPDALHCGGCIALHICTMKSLCSAALSAEDVPAAFTSCIMSLASKSTLTADFPYRSTQQAAISVQEACC